MAELAAHTIRTRDGGTRTIDSFGRKLAVELMCNECMGFGEGDPRDCASTLCPLYPFRGGRKMVAIVGDRKETHLRGPCDSQNPRSECEVTHGITPLGTDENSVTNAA